MPRLHKARVPAEAEPALFLPKRIKLEVPKETIVEMLGVSDRDPLVRLPGDRDSRVTRADPVGLRGEAASESSGNFNQQEK